MNKYMDKDFISALVAMTMGVGVGALLSIGGQKLLNNYNQDNCPRREGKILVKLTNSFVGDAYYCINKVTYEQ